MNIELGDKIGEAVEATARSMNLEPGLFIGLAVVLGSAWPNCSCTALKSHSVP